MPFFPVVSQVRKPRFGCGGEKVVAAVPVLNAALADRAQVRLVDQGRGLECLPERAG